MSLDTNRNNPKAWGRLRFAIIGPLLAAPPPRGELCKSLAALAARTYRHPLEPDKQIQFKASSIERWYYRALGASDPVAELMNKVRSDTGRSNSMSAELLSSLGSQYKEHPKWTYQLHFDNLLALAAERPELGPVPTYATVRRRMQANGWYKKKGLPRNPTPGRIAAVERFEQFEVRSYEVSHVNALWHLDFHECSRSVVDAKGRYHKPLLLGILDDKSRLSCHAQWYLAESAENLYHGLCQAFQKRGLARALMTDNGSAMTASETRNGLELNGIIHELTLVYSPYQNGKQECFWGQVEGRLMAMLEKVEPLTLSMLNRATQAWVERDYNRSHHEELDVSPLKRFLDGPDVSRSAPGMETLRITFSVEQTRMVRRSDGTITVHGIRFEIPSRMIHFRKLHIRYQRWDLSQAYIVDERSGNMLARIYPLDKLKNADGRRKVRERPSGADEITGTGGAGASENQVVDPLPPLMRKLLADYAATGLPPAYIPKDEHEDTNDDD